MPSVTKLIDGWHRYPLNFATKYPEENLQYYYEQLNERAVRLFTSKCLQLKIHSRSKCGAEVNARTIARLEDFEGELEVSWYPLY